jgi:ribosomal protein L7/L12
MDDSARISLLELKLGELERKLNFVLDQLKLQYTPEPLSPAQAEANNWLHKGNKIEAVKSYQKLAGVGLKEAKDAVDALELRMKGG